ncbi:MAG: radical SAM protein [Hominenteromicrobium sp.]
MRALIDRCKEQCLNGQALSRGDIIALLDIPVGSADDEYLRSAARDAAARITENQGYIWCAVGMDYAPCPMNCRFCSFGEEWGLIREPRHVTEDEIIAHIRYYVENGAAYIVLRTTEFYSIDTLLDCIPVIRREVPGNYAIILNTGELDTITAQRVSDAGVYGVYHALRLREGTDTPFSTAKRMQTMQSVTQTPLKLISLVEPIGPEHTSEELADRFLNTVACGASIGGAMMRFPVPGTPLGSTARLSDEQMAHIIAALRLSGGSTIRDICVHPASPAAMRSGANVLVVESGAIPRDTQFSETNWAGTDMEKATALLRMAGYRPSMVNQKASKKKCPCEGGNLEKYLQPILLHILRQEALNGYAVYSRIADYATYRDSTPDVAATYRYLKRMHSRGLLTCSDGLYQCSEEGLRCLATWKQTISDYVESLNALQAQLKS